eukprot:CAMPEP_0206006358 /NCGR_PEP_ID=MMETSP1464-20131121/5126_1 /ASSEMBLY_ACC=CAM_ASM_001124 /TAXON_ID=119497 /ORGANISM="Exanthemachrysis gayraliae, Strain RCC1523" /LENGTH=276 /DNA_ID=CAMNT_0053379827 /DNA_START=522 /DNA_END=1351 /DNA_ORIENTATION=+
MGAPLTANAAGEPPRAKGAAPPAVPPGEHEELLVPALEGRQLHDALHAPSGAGLVEEGVVRVVPAPPLAHVDDGVPAVLPQALSRHGPRPGVHEEQRAPPVGWLAEHLGPPEPHFAHAEAAHGEGHLRAVVVGDDVYGRTLGPVLRQGALPVPHAGAHLHQRPVRGAHVEGLSRPRCAPVALQVALALPGQAAEEDGLLLGGDLLADVAHGPLVAPREGPPERGLRGLQVVDKVRLPFGALREVRGEGGVVEGVPGAAGSVGAAGRAEAPAARAPA